MNYSKTWGMVVATVLSAVLPALVDGSLSPTEWINVALAFVGAVSVAIVPNLNAGVGKYAKAAVAVAAAVLTLLVSLIDGGLSTPEILQLVIAALGAVGVVSLPGPQFSAQVARV
jgi:peptidoglycan/LPS O-acetylase OafA/YrhL